MSGVDQTVVLASLLCKKYQIGDIEISALKNLGFRIGEGEFAVFEGASGAGKTTLLNIVGGIDKPSSGRIIVFDHDLAVEDEDSLADFRCKKVGFVFQSYNLISTLTVAENIAFPIEWIRKPENYIGSRVQELLRLVDLVHRADHFPSQLSGGEQQRVAFARALANDPPLFLADEPTGNLDVNTGSRIVEILQRLKEEGKTALVATHDERIVKLADRRFYVEEGKLVESNE